MDAQSGLQLAASHLDKVLEVIDSQPGVSPCVETAKTYLPAKPASFSTNRSRIRGMLLW